MTKESEVVLTVAGLMALSARTAPKGKGVDTIDIHLVHGREINKLSHTMAAYGKRNGIGFFIRDSKNVLLSTACIVIGAKGNNPVGVNCGACGYPNCAEFTKGWKKRTKKTTAYTGPNCAIRMTDLGIAVGSAAKTASIHNVDNRIMYSAGVAAIELGLMDVETTVAYGIPLSATGKNIFFDRSA
ncbi:MAG: DUF2148 domain-containing protein [Methanoregulaceae archaeon]|jgi:uncharacterized ferredoxin-like protein